MLKRSARDKHSSLLRRIVNCGRKSFVRLTPGAQSHFLSAEQLGLEGVTLPQGWPLLVLSEHHPIKVKNGILDPKFLAEGRIFLPPNFYYRTACMRHLCRKTAVFSCHRHLINNGDEKWTTFKCRLKFDHQMSLSEKKIWYSSKCLHFKVRCSISQFSNLRKK